jgi:GTP cyclohydrolase FolE2
MTEEMCVDRKFLFFFPAAFKDPDEEGLVKFLCGEKNFNEDRVRKAVQKLRKSKSTSVQV